jgi:hypothetical protein
MESDGPRAASAGDPHAIALLQQDAPWIYGFHPKELHAGPCLGAQLASRPMAATTSSSTSASTWPSGRTPAAEWNRPVLWPLGLLAVAVLLPAAIHRARTRRRADAHAGARREQARAAPDAGLHRPPPALRHADPDRREPAHLRPVLRGQHARRHGAHAARRQARHAGGHREAGRPSAATTSRCSSTTRRRARAKLTETIFFEKSVRCSRSISAAPTTAATSATRSSHPHGPEPGHRRADLRPRPAGHGLVRPAAGSSAPPISISGAWCCAWR